MADAQFVCERCWNVFDDGGRSACAECKAPAPDAGWSPMPLRFRKTYLFERQLGRGGMGAVFAAKVIDEPEVDMPTDVAIKVMQQRPDISEQDQAALRQRFDIEQRASKLLDHSERFIRVHAVMRRYLVMERVAWPTLESLRTQGTSFAPVQVAQLGAEVLAGVEEMHGYGVIHRDLKPANLFINLDGKHPQVKIADFGVCLIGRQNTRQGTTRTGVRVGTPDYMSPEQVDDSDNIGPQADVYAVASVLWEAIEGVVPFPLPAGAGTVAERMLLRAADQQRRPDRPKSMSRWPKLYEVLAKALARDLNERYASAREFGDALHAFVAGWEAETEAAHARARRNLEAMHGRIAQLRTQLEPVRKLDAILDEIERGVDAHDDRIDNVGKETIAETLDDLTRYEAQLELCASNVARLVRVDEPKREEETAAPTVASQSQAPAADTLRTPEPVEKPAAKTTKERPLDGFDDAAFGVGLTAPFVSNAAWVYQSPDANEWGAVLLALAAGVMLVFVYVVLEGTWVGRVLAGASFRTQLIVFEVSLAVPWIISWTPGTQPRLAALFGLAPHGTVAVWLALLGVEVFAVIAVSILLKLVVAALRDLSHGLPPPGSRNQRK